jgi:hypothetical protein
MCLLAITTIIALAASSAGTIPQPDVNVRIFESGILMRSRHCYIVVSVIVQAVPIRSSKSRGARGVTVRSWITKKALEAWRKTIPGV